MGTEMVTLREAAKLTGKSLDTLRRWIRAGHVEAEHAGDSPSAPVLVQRASLLAYAATIGGTPVGAASIARAGAKGVPSSVLAAVQSHLHTLERERDDLVAQRDGLRRELADTRTELAAARAELAEKSKRLDAVERELAGGVRGLLTGAVKRRLGL